MCVCVCVIAGGASVGFSPPEWVSSVDACSHAPLCPALEKPDPALPAWYSLPHALQRGSQASACVCGPSASLRVCACGIWLWDVEGQVEKWMYRLCVWQPGVSVKLTLTEYGRAAWEDQQLINRQYHNTFWCKWQAKHWDLHAWTCARAVLTVKVTVSLGEGVLQVGAELMNGGFQVCAALLTQFLLHLQSTAGETLRTHLQMISWKRQRIVTSVNKSVNGVKEI